jgi:hypothetical protein
MDGKYVTLEYVTLVSKLDDSKLICDTPAKAVKALDELGMCSNQAVLTTFQGKGQRLPLLMYQGVRYKASNECYVKLPFSEYENDLGDKLQRLLEKIFKPFIFPDYYSKRSYITMSPDPGDNRCFLFNLCLMFKDEAAFDSIAAELSKAADDEETVEARYFILD